MESGADCAEGFKPFNGNRGQLESTVNRRLKGFLVGRLQVSLGSAKLPLMEYVVYVLGLCALLGCFYLYRRTKRIKRVSDYYTIRSTLPVDGDPFDDRIEFHIRKRHSG